MRLLTATRLRVLGLAICAVLVTGCATKKYVRRTVSPIEQRVGELDKKTAEHADSIEELDRAVSQANERAMTAGNRAEAAAREAARAGEQAALAGKGATDARALAEKGLTITAELERTLGATIENLDNYKLVATETVLFAFGRSDLSEEAEEQLDHTAEKLLPMKHYVLEVQGFTDRIGPREYNLELSRRRAAAVVRYLTAAHKIPLHRIHTLGYGSGIPIGDNSTREGRKQNRRVEVRLFVADWRGAT